ncbi:MAG: hypothetical protein ACOH1Y_00170 [Propionicimonas sp.]
MARVVRLSAEEWASAVNHAEAAAIGDEVGAGDADSLVAAVAQHLVAPVRASFIATSGQAGTITRLTLVEDRALLVTQPIAEGDGETRFSGDVQVVFAGADEVWAAVSSTLAPIPALRAPASASAAKELEVVPAGDVTGLLEREQANLQVRVEAWRVAARPAVVWARLWSVVDDRLLDVRSADGELTVVERGYGAVAAELEWALVGAVEAATGAAHIAEEQ